MLDTLYYFDCYPYSGHAVAVFTCATCYFCRHTKTDYKFKGLKITQFNVTTICKHVCAKLSTACAMRVVDGVHSYIHNIFTSINLTIHVGTFKFAPN